MEESIVLNSHDGQDTRSPVTGSQILVHGSCMGAKLALLKQRIDEHYKTDDGSETHTSRIHRNAHNGRPDSH